jgi:eukaryotic-like serine/threonine-protein kinase
VGTIPYMAPELIDPATWGKAELPARDVFAFGVLACEILLRRHPTGLGAKASIVDFARAYKAAQAGLIAWPPAGLDGAWQAAVGACLALHPQDRPANGAALCAILRDGSARGAAVSSSSATTTPHRPAQSSTSPPPLTTTAPMVEAKAAPMVSAKAAPKPRSSGWATAALGFLAAMFAVAGVILAAGLFQSTGSSEPAPRPSVPVPTAAPSEPPAPHLMAVAPSHVAPTGTAEIGACCPRGSVPCKGPTRFQCAPCTDDSRRIPHGVSWTLRVVSVTLGDENLLQTRPSAVLTLRLGASTQDLPFTHIARGRAGEPPFTVTTEDVERGGVLVTLAQGGKVLADGTVKVDPSKGPDVKLSALCIGLRLHLDSSVGTITLGVYLDPVKPTP